MKNTLKGLASGILIVSLSTICSSCKKMIEIDPPIDKIVSKNAFENTGTATSAITGLYISMIGDYFGPFSGDKSISTFGSFLADECDLGGFGFNSEFYKNSIPSYDTSEYWKKIYSDYIFRTNSIIEGVSASKTLTDQLKNRITGEAKFLRAFYYFQLVNFYGDVPLALTTDFLINSNLPRAAKKDVYLQIIDDLLQAKFLLTENYLGSNLSTYTDERIRPNKAAATALLARVYLYLGEWKNAEKESSEIISNGNYELPEDLNAVFLKNSKETIWQLQPNQADPNGKNTNDGRFLIPQEGTVPNAFLSVWLKSSFETGDKRLTDWVKEISVGAITYLIPYKYKIGNDANAASEEYVMVLRLAEQYLIRAESRSELGNIIGANSAESDLNTVRKRAGLSGTTASDQNSMLKAIAKERQTELFMEWAHRWFDLKRNGQINEVMTQVMPTKIYFGTAPAWSPYMALFPIPEDQFRINPALRGHQNPGYTELN